jgi:hypothetical protein
MSVISTEYILYLEMSRILYGYGLDINILAQKSGFGLPLEGDILYSKPYKLKVPISGLPVNRLASWPV